MTKVSQHFNREEFACSCGCGFKAVDIEVLQILEKVRSHFKDLPLYIHCACRCLAHNRSLKSKDTSQHIRGIAVDFSIKGVKNQDIYNYLDGILDNGCLIIYPWGIHFDIRGFKKRLDKR